MRSAVLASAALLACPAQAHAHNPSDPSALVRALEADDVAAVRAELAHHADPNARIAFGATPLALAVHGQDPAMVGALLVSGAKPDLADADGVTPLALACELGHPGIIAQLLDARASVAVPAPDGTTPLAICARFGPAEAVARMLTAGAAADSLDSRGQTPLMWAAASGRIEATALLLKAGADANRVSKAGFTPLFFAIKSGVPRATEVLLAAGADAQYRGPERTSAVQLAVYQRNYAAAAMLVARGGVDLAERDRNGNQLLHAAAEGGAPALVDLLLAKGADANALTGPSRITWVTEANFGVPPPRVPPTPPLIIAAAKGHAGVMKRLLAAGADPHFVAQDGTNVLLAAARGASAPAFDLALKLAPDANVVNADGVTALQIVIGGGVQPDLRAMLQTLAAHGARTAIKPKRGDTAAVMALTGLSEVKAIYLDVFGPIAPSQQSLIAR